MDNLGNELIALRNILEAHGEEPSSLLDCIGGTHFELCDIVFDDYTPFTINSILEGISDYNTFYSFEDLGSFQEFIDDYKDNEICDGCTEEQANEYIKTILNAGDGSKEVVKTSEGYVRILHY